MFTPRQLDLLASDDFNRARFKAALRRIITRLLRKRNDLLTLNHILECLPLLQQHGVGLRSVEIDRIIGTHGRHEDFDRSFGPLHNTYRQRWMTIGKLNYIGTPLPPVDLYKINEVYFVIDGHHRISVARERGQKFVDAYVTEIILPIEITPDTNVNDLRLGKA
jgi:hypothetical protein